MVDVGQLLIIVAIGSHGGITLLSDHNATPRSTFSYPQS